MSWFATVAPLPPDPVLGISEAFQIDPRTEKLNLTIGAYRDEHLDPFIFKAVKIAEKEIWETQKDKDYLPMAGDGLFIEKVGELAFGENWQAHRKRIAGIQTAGGTGALRIAGEFLRPLLKGEVYISKPTWPNHRHVMQESGFNVKEYPYHDKVGHRVDFDRTYQFFEGLPPASILILQVSCHNPTGCDLTTEQWKKISQLMRQKKLFPLFDCAYQGFGDGLVQDVEAIKLFLEDGHELMVTYSCSKTFSLYCERVGALFVVSEDENICANILSVLKMTTRGILSTPPAHGARVVARILHEPALHTSWQEQMEMIRERVRSMRHKLIEALGKEYAFIEREKGLFCITGLTDHEVDAIRHKYGIYMTRDGRINLAGLNEEAISWLAEAIRTKNTLL